MTDKTPNYTKEMEDKMSEMYLANPTRETVEELAEMFGKKTRSVISKLSSMKIYVVPEKTTKNGSPIVKKEDLVKLIEAHLDVSLPSLGKTNKRDLQELVDSLNDHFGEVA